MASPSASQASKPVSSRLLNMKFMQKPLSSKAAVSSPTSNSPSKHPSSASSPSTTSKPKPSTSADNISRSAILAAQALESSRREAAINSTTFGAAERWSLSLPASERANEIRGGGEMVGGVKVFMTGNTRWSSEHAHDQDDDNSDDDEEATPTAPVRRYFGGRTAPVLEKKSTQDGDSDASDSEDDTSASESEVLRRVESKRAAKALKKEKDADRTLRNLKQIGGRAKTTPGLGDMECFGCGEKGHRKSDCPSARQKGNKGRDSRPGRGGVKREYDSFGGPAIKKQKRY
ncbi:hypothetical protein TWF281_005309 [Arthrobotrys megalospora]